MMREGGNMKNKLRQSIEEHAFNEEKMLWQIKAQTRAMGIKPQVKEIKHLPKFFKVALTFAMVLVFALLGIATLSDFNPLQPDPNTITAIYGLDINPSFEISVNKQDKVILITPTNDDAKSITVEDLYGKDATYVIEALIKRAEAAGFLDSTDLVDDYVLITAIPMSVDDEIQTDLIEEKMKEQTKTSEYLQNLNVAVIKSDKVTLLEAEGKKIPVGLYVINGMVKQPDGTYIGAGEFFSDPENRATFQKKGEIKEDKVNKLKARILTALAKLDAIGVDTADIKTRLITAEDQEIIDIQTEVRRLLNKHHLGSTSEVNADKTDNA